jgi:hypothetical protein
MAKTLNNPTGNVVKKSLDLANAKSKGINQGKPKKIVGSPKKAPSMIKKFK